MREVTERGLVPVHNQSTAVEVARARLIDREQFTLMQAIAQTATKAGSGMVPDSIKTEQQAMAVMLAGWEMGFSPFAALRLVFPVNGKLNVMTEGYMALVRQRGGRFIFHALSDLGADVELVIKGESRIRIAYTEAERIRAHQGMKRAASGGPREWLPVNGPDGKQKVYPEGHARAGKGVFQKNPDYRPKEGPERWVEDPDSPWTKHRADMYAWASCKRCIKFGASDFTDLGPVDAPEFDDIEESELSRAMFAGEWKAADLDDDPGEDDEAGWPEGSEEPEEDGPGLEAQVEPDGAPVQGQGQPSPANKGIDPEAPAEPRLIELIQKVLTDLKGTWPPKEYGELIRDLTAKYGWKDANDFKKLGAADAAECLAELRKRQGAPEEPGPEPTDG
jgi:hypothetical protein